MKEEEYIDAIIGIFKVEGIGLSMDAIADRIGITRKTLYNRFKSKDELMERCLDRLSSIFVKEIECLADESVDVVQGFRNGIMGMWKFFCNSSHIFTHDMITVYPSVASRQQDTGRLWLNSKIRINIERGQADGTYRKDIDPLLMSRYIGFSIFAFFHNELKRGETTDFDDYFKKVIDYNIHALLAQKTEQCHSE